MGNSGISEFHSQNYLHHLIKTKPFHFPEIGETGFVKSQLKIPVMNISEQLIKNYAEKRDLPALDATSKLGVYLRFGTISIREVTRIALDWSEVFLNALIWQNIFSQILRHFPQVENRYILKWVSEYGTVKYPQPIVEHAFARERVLRVYKNALG
ncbi:MAG: deoxyribodipyrimidine [Prolixibacteraceae bacterium]|nr:MAG: deoxyribodipyrimidine [Prolixibacteraceae bacterium]